MTSSRNKSREGRLRRKYGLTLIQYDELLRRQKNRCAICKKHKKDEKRSLAVDHDHVTRAIRGLLCSYCNHRRVGRARDPKILRVIADYLEQHTGLYVPKKR